MESRVVFSSKCTEWETPKEVFDEAVRRWGALDLDVCATPSNTKCETFFGPPNMTEIWTPPPKCIGIDGLEQSWAGHRFWMNPPYGRSILGKWVEKAVYEVTHNGAFGVILIPARTSNTWFQECIWGKDGPQPWVRGIYFWAGRIQFVGAEAGAPFPSVLVALGGGASVAVHQAASERVNRGVVQPSQAEDSYAEPRRNQLPDYTDPRGASKGLLRRWLQGAGAYLGRNRSRENGVL